MMAYFGQLEGSAKVGPDQGLRIPLLMHETRGMIFSKKNVWMESPTLSWPQQAQCQCALFRCKCFTCNEMRFTEF